MADTPQQDFPLVQRDYDLGALIDEATKYVMQIRQDEDGRWTQFLGAYEDRDDMTRIQAYRLLDVDLKGEKRRILRHVHQIFVDEIEGDGEGETSAEELIARNKANTDRRLEAEEQQQPGT